MDYYFFDTSALVKRYHGEIGTDKVDAIINGIDRKIYISTLSFLELHAAFGRRVRVGEITKDHYTLITGYFVQDCIQDMYLLCDVDLDVLTETALILKSYAWQYPIRTLDSIQLSAALRIQKTQPPLNFVCADRQLCALADMLGLKVFNPEI